LATKKKTCTIVEPEWFVCATR